MRLSFDQWDANRIAAVSLDGTGMLFFVLSCFLQAGIQMQQVVLLQPFWTVRGP